MVHGTYNPTTHEIIVYVNNHSTIKELTNTIIHEYIHARQKNRSFNKKYNEQNNTVGYLKNIYEVESRIISGKNEKKCVRDITSKYKVLQW